MGNVDRKFCMCVIQISYFKMVYFHPPPPPSMLACMQFITCTDHIPITVISFEIAICAH